MVIDEQEQQRRTDPSRFGKRGPTGQAKDVGDPPLVRREGIVRRRPRLWRTGEHGEGRRGGGMGEVWSRSGDPGYTCTVIQDRGDMRGRALTTHPDERAAGLGEQAR